LNLFFCGLPGRQVPEKAASLNSGDSFVLVTPGAVYTWKGVHCLPEELAVAENIAICWLFDMRFLTQLLLGGILAAYLGIMMHLIFDMNQPFRGDVSITAEPFEVLYKRMNDA
jgi:hypothetical protein